jgi:hypothetical protein
VRLLRSLRGARRVVLLVCAAAMLGGGAVALAQRFGGFGGFYPNVEYDGRFQLVRLRYIEYRSSGWAYDYPDMEENLMTMFDELTTLRIARKGSNIFAMDDPELMKFPVSYLSEPGFWYPSEREAAGLRNYLKKGGFLIVDDFMLQNEWNVFRAAMRQVLPDAQIFSLPPNDPILDSFYRITSLEMPYPGRPSLQAQFLAIYEDNDPTKRMMVVINFNNDIGDYMEHSGQGWWPVNITNDAYKFAMNYIIYGLTF